MEPAIGHLKQDNGMGRCWLQGATGDALHAVLCAAGNNIRWLLRAIVRLGLASLVVPVFAALVMRVRTLAMALGMGKARATRVGWAAF